MSIPTRPSSSLAAALAVLGVALCLTAPASAQTAAPAPEPKWYEAVTVNGFLAASYSYNTNRPLSGTNQLRVFDFDDQTFKVDVAELVVQKAIAKPGEVGFRVDAVAGSSIPRVSAASGLFRDPATGKAQDFDLQQAFVSWIVPVGSGLRLDFGKFVTSMGYEVIEGYDGYNDNASRSILFGYAEAATHTGLKATYAFSDKVSAMFHVVNGWDNARDNNTAKTLGMALTVTPSSAFSLTANYMIGPEQTGNNSNNRSLLDLIATVKPSDTVTLGANVDLGSEEGLTTTGGTARWWGAAGYLRLGLSSSFALCLRGEYFDDRDGTRTGVAQKLKEVTLTPEYKVSPHLVLRGDLRVDVSDQAVYEDASGALTKKRQPTVSLNVLYLF